MRKPLFVTLLLACGMPLTGSFTAFAAPEPQSQSQSVVTITGTVFDENNEPVIGASVVQKGVTANATATDFDGNFSIRVPEGTLLNISFIGYKPVEIAAKEGMMVYLQPTTEMLNELVAIGYGQQKRANLTGAVATVDVARVMDSRPVQDVTKALQGAVPGLTITNSNGDINGTASIRLRGTGTLSNNQSSAPLMVVDGIVTDDISFLNPDDIADISVLKDAASASIYGTRAAFGVILITTKTSSSKDRVSVKYNNNFGWSQATKLPDYPSVATQITALTEGNLISGGEIGLFGMDPWTMIPLAQQWADEHNGQKAGYREMVPWTSDSSIGDYKITDDGTGLYYADWDVAGIMFNNAAFSNNHNVSLEGTSGKTTYRASFGYSMKSDLMKFNPAQLRRYNGTATISTEIFSWLKAGARFTFSEKDYTAPYNVRGDYVYMWRWGSYFGPYGYSRDAEGNIVDYRNDIAYRKQAGETKSSYTDTRMTAFLDATIIPGLVLHGDFSYDVINGLETTAYMPVYGYNSWGAITEPTYIVPVSYADARQTNTKSDTWTMNAYATYSKSFNQAHNLKIMLGGTAEQNDYNQLYGKRDELLTLDQPYLGLTTGGSNKTGYTITQAITHWATAGFFGRVNYDYNGIYLVEFNGRYDGSSRFPADDQWAFFPSGSAGYRFSEEKYFEPVKEWWSNGKIRASYGSVGNQAVGENMFLSTIEGPVAGTWIGTTGGAIQYSKMPTLVSRTLTWERVTTADVGIDLGFFNNSLNASFDWYDRHTTNMLGPSADLPAVLGADAPYGNNGALRTRGWELAVNWNHSFGDADIFVGATIADARTKIESWRNDTGKLYSWTPSQNNYTEGAYYGDIWGFETDRYFEASDMDENGRPKQDQSDLESGSFKYGVGDVMFKDLNGDGKITFGDPNMRDEDGNLIPVGTTRNHGDLKLIGNTQPRYEYSFRLGGQWKGFDLDMFFQGVGKREMWFTSSFVIPFARGTDALYANQTSYNERVIDFANQCLTGEVLVDQNNFYPAMYPGAGLQGRLSGINAGCYNFYPQSKYLMNMAYLRFKNLTVGYTLPANITQKALIQKARIYFTAENLCLLYDGMKNYPLDPEITTGGSGTESQMSGSGYFGRTTPMSRTFSFGMQVTF